MLRGESVYGRAQLDETRSSRTQEAHLRGKCDLIYIYIMTIATLYSPNQQRSIVDESCAFAAGRPRLSNVLCRFGDVDPRRLGLQGTAARGDEIPFAARTAQPYADQTDKRTTTGWHEAVHFRCW